MDLSVVAVVASIAAGVSILVAVAAVFAARRSTAHADLALKEASRISRASISRINEVQSEASSARLAARHAAERLRSMTKERTTPDSVAAYRVFLREVVEDSKHLLGPEGTGTMKNEALDRLRVGALVGGSDEVLRALRNFALLRTQRPEAPWPSAYAMAYARLESDLVTAIRNDLGSSEESLTADQIWGAVNARCVDPAFRLALLSPLEDVLRNAGQDPTHYDLDHLIKPTDYLGALGSTEPAASAASASAGPATPAPTARTAASESRSRRRSRRTQSRVAREASARIAETTGPTAPAGGATTAGAGLPDSSDVVWAPLTPGRRGSHAPATQTPSTVPAASTVAASDAPATNAAAPSAPQAHPLSGVDPTSGAGAEALQVRAPDGSSAAAPADAWAQAVATQHRPSLETSPHTEQAQPASPTSHRAPEPQRPVFEDPTPSRIARRRRRQESPLEPSTPSTQAAAVPDAGPSPRRAATTAMPMLTPTTGTSLPSEAAPAVTSTPTASTTTSPTTSLTSPATTQPTSSAPSSAPASTAAAPGGTSTTSDNTEETEPVFAPAFPEALTRSRAAEPAAPAATAPSGTTSTAVPEQPAQQPQQQRATRSRASAPSMPRDASTTASPVRATAVAAQTVTVSVGPQAGPHPSATPSVPAAPARPVPATGAAGADGYGFIPAQGTDQAPAQVPARTGAPVGAPFTGPGIPAPQQTDLSSAVAAAGAVPASAVGSHRAAAVPARTAAPTWPARATEPDTQETITVPTGPPSAPATAAVSTETAAQSAAHSAAPTSAAWSFTPPSLQDSAEIPQARGA